MKVGLDSGTEDRARIDLVVGGSRIIEIIGYVDTSAAKTVYKGRFSIIKVSSKVYVVESRAEVGA